MTKQSNQRELPVLPLRGVVVFPKAMVNLDINRVRSVSAIKDAIKKDKKIFIVTQKNVKIVSPKIDDVYNIGTVCEIKQFQKYSDLEFKLTAIGKYKARISKLISSSNGLSAVVERISERMCVKKTDKIDAVVRAIKKKFVEYGLAIKNVNKEIILLIESEKDPFNLFIVVVGIMPLKTEVKQKILEESNLFKKLQMLLEAVTEEVEVATVERKIMEKVENRIDKNQRNYFLKEQIRAIKEELKDDIDSLSSEENSEYFEKIYKIKDISDDSREKLINEVKKMDKMMESSHEAFVITNYLDTVLRLPWDKKTVDDIDIQKASKVLNENHYGMKKVKERILENLAVMSLNPTLKGQILCLVGPPGVGKTSISRSIAKAIGRKFSRISLAGANDESDLRGHKKTYIGSMPGRIINAIIQAKSKNPLLLLDEIDKIGYGYKGDPSSVILEILDPEQNSEFVDHYIDIPFDISNCFFITTANSISSISPPLLDRMEIIEISSYTYEEKFNIAKNHLLPKQLKQNGLVGKPVSVSDEALYELINSYTREAGVRNLERTIAALFRKAAKEFLSGDIDKINFDKDNLSKYLGAKKYMGEKISNTDEVGLVNGLAWTTVGGELMQIEAGIMDGKGNVQLTGNLGDVMKESANTAISFVRSIASKYNISKDFYKDKDIHIHVPEGAVAKDGPSAGVALATVLVSALSNTPIRRDVAMTGEISLRGRDLAIGGLKEKVIAAYKSGVKTVLIPQDNIQDLDEIDESVKNAIELIPCKTADQVLEHALIKVDDSNNYSAKCGN